MCGAFVLDPQVADDKTRFVVCVLKKSAYFSKEYANIFPVCIIIMQIGRPLLFKSPYFNHSIRSIKVDFLF